MSHAKGKHLGGVRTLEDLKARCYIDEAGCWILRSKATREPPQVKLASDALPIGMPRPGSARRAAYILSGKPIREDQCLIPKMDGHSMRCICPDHYRLGSRKDLLDNTSRRGMLSTPARQAHLIRLSASRPLVTTPDKVADIERALDTGATRQRIAQQFGVHVDTVRSIARGLHIHQRQRLVRTASVFAWGAAA